MASKHTPLQVRVVSRPADNPDSNIKRRQIDLRSTADRDWLAKHQYWCAMHGHSCAIFPVSDNDPA